MIVVIIAHLLCMWMLNVLRTVLIPDSKDEPELSFFVIALFPITIPIICFGFVLYFVFSSSQKVAEYLTNRRNT